MVTKQQEDNSEKFFIELKELEETYKNQLPENVNLREMITAGFGTAVLVIDDRKNEVSVEIKKEIEKLYKKFHP